MRRTAICAALAATAHFSVAHASETRTMKLDGANIAYTDQGRGTPVVFVHGAISDARVWEGYADRIAETGRFVSYTQRYFGASEWPDDGDRFSRDTHISDLIAFIEGLDAGPVHLVTWSYSGEVATYAALRRPDLFRSMVHYEPAVFALLDGLPGAGAAAADFGATLGPVITALKKNRSGDAALRLIEAVFRMPEGSANDEPEPFPTYWRENGRTLPLFMSMEQGDPLSCSEVERLDIPTLVVLGAETHVQYAVMAERLAHCSRNALLVGMEGVTHDGPYQNPERFGDLVMAFHTLVQSLED